VVVLEVIVQCCGVEGWFVGAHGLPWALHTHSSSLSIYGTGLLKRCAGMELEVGMWIGLHIFANLLT